jgi:hypothetical protein
MKLNHSSECDVPRFAADDAGYPAQRSVGQFESLNFYCINCYRKGHTRYLTGNLGPFCDECWSELERGVEAARS